MPKSSTESGMPISASSSEHAQGAVRVDHDRALGDLELQLCRREPFLVEDAAHGRDELDVEQVGDGEVDRDRKVDGPRRRHGRHCRTARRSTSSVSGLIRPVCSARGMNSSGLIVPRSGCSQRASASTPIGRSVRTSNFGW